MWPLYSPMHLYFIKKCTHVQHITSGTGLHGTIYHCDEHTIIELNDDTYWYTEKLDKSKCYCIHNHVGCLYISDRNDDSMNSIRLKPICSSEEIARLHRQVEDLTEMCLNLRAPVNK